MKKLDWSGCLTGLPVPSSPAEGGGLWKTGVLSSIKGVNWDACGCGGNRCCDGESGTGSIRESTVYRRRSVEDGDNRRALSAERWLVRDGAIQETTQSKLQALGSAKVYQSRAGDHWGMSCDQLQAEYNKHAEILAFVNYMMAGATEPEVILICLAAQREQTLALADVAKEACMQGCEWAVDARLCQGALNA